MPVNPYRVSPSKFNVFIFECGNNNNDRYPQFVEAGASLAEPEYYELDLIRKAVALRPAWPYGWMFLVEAKARHRQIDEEFNRSLVQAITLGPWEREVMERAARLGHYYQGEVNAGSRGYVRDQFSKVE
ncbi:hypothetical protein [Endozoicomonas euniceicola]|uniref:Uncharacterized protein n=1 Tax=Endozoicomonas euniceicola TaxID=1234143 RepID=A0ABY6GTK9_9GAMM|nr:hypothetical protein [Endozoicomonas euniceicola]UYM15729.1 hypothetical protein NX720_23350 [Endozoicomonas euniceicola]